MSDETPDGELTSAAEIAEARKAFLSAPPDIPNTLDDEPVVVDDAALEDAALADLTKPPAGAEGTSTEPVAPPAGAPDPYEQFGGLEQVQLAAQIQDALRTEQGVRALVANGLTALGYKVPDVQAALAAIDAGETPGAPAPAEIVDPFAGLDDDDAVSVGGIKEYLAQVVAQVKADAAQAAAEQALAGTQAQIEPVAQAIAAQQQAQVRNNTDAALISLLGPVPADPAEAAQYRSRVDEIVARAGQYYDSNQWADPNHIATVVQRAKAELDAADEARFQTYLAGKKKARDSAPPNIGGGAGGEDAPKEPKNMAEARAAARAGGFFD